MVDTFEEVAGTLTPTINSLNDAAENIEEDLAALSSLETKVDELDNKMVSIETTLQVLCDKLE